MRKDFCGIMKEICEDEKISLEQLAKKMTTTKQELEDYLSGQKKPNLEFMARFCKEFDLSLDYFLKEDMRECISDDLFVVKNSRGKCAIFDSRQGGYLTQYLYDFIDISPCGKHVARKKIDDGHYKDIIIDNKSNTSQFPNFNLSVIGNTFQYGVYFPAVNTLDKKEYLINENGRAISKGYQYISGCMNITYFAEPKGYELLRGEKFDKKSNLMKSVLLSKNGDEVEFKLEENIYFEEQKNKSRYKIMPELSTIEKAIKAIEKYGKMIVTYLPKEIFLREENYKILVKRVFDYALEEIKNGEGYLTVEDTLRFVLKTMSGLWNIWIDSDKDFIESLNIPSLLSDLRHQYYLIKRDKISKSPKI